MRPLVQRRPLKPLVVLRRAVLVALGIVVAVFVAGAIYLISLRSVSDAQARTRRIMLAHRETPGVLPAPHRLIASVIAVEDEHFYDNVVINVLTGAGRAALATLQTSQDPGGSTIDQQLAKELYGLGRAGLGSTLREIGLGVKLALRYTKQQILQMYLNVVYYGNGYWGVTQAAQGYFHARPSQLNWPEAAMLAGLLQAPSAYDPLAHYGLARQRQRHVLTQLVANHYLTARQAAVAFRSPLPLTG